MPTSAYAIGLLAVMFAALAAAAYRGVRLVRAYHATDKYLQSEAIRGQILRLLDELVLAETPPPAVPADAIRAEAWRACLRDAPIEVLAEYPGVGPATIDRLRETGTHTLQDASNLLSQLTRHAPPVGPSRAKAVRSAVNKVLHRCRQDFDSGGSRFAQQAVVEVRRLAAAREEIVATKQATAARLNTELQRLQPIVASIGIVTFWDYLRHRRATPNQPWAYVPSPGDPTAQVASPGVAVAQSPPPPVVVAVPVPPALYPTRVEAIATLLFGVARADGRLAAAERAAVRRGLAKFFETDPVLVRFIDPALDRLAAASLDIDAALRLAVTLPRRERDLLRRCAEEVASATATRHATKSQMVERLNQALTLPSEVEVSLVADPAELRSNELLDDMFGGPTPPAAKPVAVGQGLRDNALLDDVFGGR